MQTSILEASAFSGLIDLATEKLGGKALICSDEFFAEKENMLKPGRGIFIEDKYTPQGKWMDGWESRRRRDNGYDWCIVKLGLAGVIKGVDIDTNHFLGNHPPYASLEACVADPDTKGDKLKSANWVEIVPRSPLKPGSQNLFAVASTETWTHVRLNIFPDGGVARLKIFGDVTPNWSALKPDAIVDLAAVEYGGKVVGCNDMFFGNMDNLIMPGRGKNMGDAWETRRKRGPGYDWAIVKLGAPGVVKKLDVDTAWHIGNYPDMCSIDGCFSPDLDIDNLTWPQAEWKELLPKSKLEADRPHHFEKQIIDIGTITHVRLNIYPDGGVARLRVYSKRAQP
ncbi:MAG: allantoicase [Cyanobacteria bacterium REEB67]|nr:allantoicase [Cyanobacteria bacterium REEB67]